MKDQPPRAWIEPVHARYAAQQRRNATLEIWSTNRKLATIARGRTLRIIAGEPFEVTSTATDWQNRDRCTGAGTSVGVWYVDIAAFVLEVLQRQTAIRE